MRRAAIALLLLAALAGAAPAPAAAPKASVTDIEDEVMCPICGTLLELAESPQAKREKVFIAKLVAEGRTKAEIKDALVAQYGPAVLALPPASGFDLSAYLVPLVAFAIAVAALAVGVRRWRRSGGAGEERAPSPPSEEDAARLDEDLGRYDL
jgi:cytochrome c-type biogenesis protein CcmH